MSVVPRRWPLPAPQVAEAVAAMYCGKRERPLPVLMRDKLGEWLADEQFAGAYGVRGKPGLAAVASGPGDGLADGGGSDRPSGRRVRPYPYRLEVGAGPRSGRSRFRPLGVE